MAILEENDILFAHKALNVMAGLTEATKRVAAAIIDHFNKRTGQCDPSIERLATLLGIDRATVIRATEKLHELGYVEKMSHGGKAHRASYLPNWDGFRAIVEDWDARMKTGDGPDKGVTRDVTGDLPPPAKVARLRHKPIEVTNRINPSKGNARKSHLRSRRLTARRKRSMGSGRGTSRERSAPCSCRSTGAEAPAMRMQRGQQPNGGGMHRFMLSA
ncbi:helix-turn-helix domain-containing protein [Shinella sp. S4-D37]|uniref:helix-turn-helix domain-containing protein n=1 Tax=Shinella sp. S4-D37 TaxID=3161999 RepID=UPI0034676BFD